MLQKSAARKWLRWGALGLIPFAWLTACTHDETPTPDPAAWVELFDGESLEGWQQVNGEAPYTVMDGVIRGTNVLTSPNSFLASEGRYSDFVLEFESRSIGDANSGVQFRTALAPGTWSGVVGYQLDIDPSARRWTGGIYHEGVHVWRHSMARNPACQAAYQHGAWNAYRIEAVGPVIATWVNGVPCAHMVGDHHAEGFIALQVHAIGEEESYLGSFTEWRGLRLLNAPISADLWIDRRAPLVEGWLVDAISEVEVQNGWQSFDFSNGAADLPVAGDAFELVMDLQMSEAAEGRLSYRLEHANGACQGHFALLDDAALAESRPATDHSGGLLGQVAAENLSEPGRPKRIYSDDRWNRVRILVTDDRVEHWLNSVKVVDVARCEPDLMPPAPDDAAAIALQTLNGEITFRSAKVRAISN